MPSARPVSHEDIWLLNPLQVLYTDEPYHTVGSGLQSARVALVAIRLYSLGGSGEDEIMARALNNGSALEAPWAAR
jgi:hypothetical protein